MNRTDMIRFVCERTGFPQRAVAHIVDVQMELMEQALRDGSEIHFPELFKIEPYVRRYQPAGAVPGSARAQVRLRIRPMQRLREEMNTWTE